MLELHEDQTHILTNLLENGAADFTTFTNGFPNLIGQEYVPKNIGFPGITLIITHGKPYLTVKLGQQCH